MSKQSRIKDFAIAKGHPFRGKFPKQYDKANFVYCEDKFDGLRGIVIITKSGQAKAFTSSGVEVINAKHICKALNVSPYHGRVYDGEFFYKDWNATVSIVKSQTLHPFRKKLTFKIFDCMTTVEWKKKKCTRPLHGRKTIAATIINFIQRPDIIKEVKSKQIPKTLEAVNEALAKAAKKGHEGIMVKDPFGHYIFKRSANWLKLKPYKESDLKIVAVEKGTKNKQHAKHLGNLVLVGKIDGKKIKTNVGCGFKLHERKKFWKLYKQGKLIGMRVTIKHEGVTKNGAVRFPEFLRLRTDD